MAAGICLYCGITDSRIDGDKLRWHDVGRTCCSKYSCVKQHHAMKREAAAARTKQPSRFKGWGYGAICDQLRKEQRARRRRKGRAA